MHRRLKPSPVLLTLLSSHQALSPFLIGVPQKNKKQTKNFLLSDSVDQESKLCLLLAAFFPPHAPITCKDAY
jgi:hypothetical protein